MLPAKAAIVRHVFSQGDPMGMHYHGFGAPKGEEKDHDYLWRIKRELPQNGWISIFDRSHYEDIVMPRIYKPIRKRYDRRDMTKSTDSNRNWLTDGCSIIKIFLVVSKERAEGAFPRQAGGSDQILEVRPQRP